VAAGKSGVTSVTENNSEAKGGEPRRSWIEACQYQVQRCTINIRVSDEAGAEVQTMVAAACRRLGSRLWELTAPPSSTEPEGEASLPSAGMEARGSEGPPTSRPRLRPPGRRMPRGSVLTELTEGALTLAAPGAALLCTPLHVGGTEGPPTSRPPLRSPVLQAAATEELNSFARLDAAFGNSGFILVEAQEIGAEVLAAVLRHRPRVPAPVATLVSGCLACLAWDFATELEAQSFRAGVLQTAATEEPPQRRRRLA